MIFLSTFTANAQAVPLESSDVDGLFGKYFARIVKTCDDFSEFHVVTGFNKTPNFFGEIFCTDIRNVLKKINGVTSIGTTTQLPGANVTINWPVMVTNPDISDDSLGNALVTKKYVDENFSQVEGGSVLGSAGQIVEVRFTKRFKSEPFVMAVIEDFQYEQKQEQHCWQVRKTRFGKWGWYNKTVCEWRTPLVKLNLGARVLRVAKDRAWIQISPKVQDGQVATVKWLAVNSDSLMSSIVSSIIYSNQVAASVFSEEEKERLENESQEEANEEEEEALAIQEEFERIKKEIDDMKKELENAKKESSDNKKEISILKNEINTLKKQLKSGGTVGVTEELCRAVGGYWWWNGRCDYDYWKNKNTQ